MVAILDLIALRAVIYLPTQGLGAALLNGPHGAAMAGEQTVGVALAVGRAILAEDLRQLYAHSASNTRSIVSTMCASVFCVRWV